MNKKKTILKNFFCSLLFKSLYILSNLFFNSCSYDKIYSYIYFLNCKILIFILICLIFFDNFCYFIL
ncbi:hypothetical protein RS022_03620 [Candidatus Phytoplasma rubi]|uniref:Uncharacterized protein n=1 Tax=Candidatus Phytoplasma rubi TaxID=399025 RepID=A0ABY7BTI1_9MOLU|nr:hypothetical protein RS022_03620 [Candidatus Phytoplasma rubi]